MLLLVLAAAELAAMTPAPRPVAQAQVGVRIQRAAIATADEWEKLPKADRTEVIARDAEGRPVLLRLIEHQ